MAADAKAGELYPLRFAPVYRDYIWGGQRIPRVYQRDLPPGIYAESWELSSREDGMSVAINGRWAGRSLAELILELGPRLLGTDTPLHRGFPLLIKLIDARERLSVQVHPDDEAAAQWGGEPKTEMWYVLDAEPQGRVFAGLVPGTDRRKFEAALRTGTVRELLQVVPIAPGDAIFVPGGRVHAIDAGAFLLEVQQNSDTTYRIYDWGRVGHDGRPRRTHIAEALRVIRWQDSAPVKLTPKPMPCLEPNVREEIAHCPYFRMERWRLRTPVTLRPTGQSFAILFVVSGVVAAQWEDDKDSFRPGTTVLVPASMSPLTLRPGGGGADLLLIQQPRAPTVASAPEGGP